MTKPIHTTSGEELVVGLSRKEDDGRMLARMALTHSDLLPARDETWWHGLRAGVLGPELSLMNMQVIPGENRAADRIAGYFIELHDGKRSYRRHFSLASVAGVASRAAAPLIKEGVLAEGDQYSFFLTTVRGETNGEAHEGPAPGREEVRVRRRTEPLVFERGRLDDYLTRSEPLKGASAPQDEENPAPMPVFIADEVWQEGHELARRGGERESAAVWTGRLCQDTESPELFMVLDACIEAEHAAEEQFKVTFTGETWARVRELLEIRRRRLNRPHERVCGSVHGHNFGVDADVNGKKKCEACDHVAVCSRTTAVASAADLEWHRSVFVGQPWAVLLVWGFNARDDEDWRLYGLSDASLAPRTIRWLR